MTCISYKNTRCSINPFIKSWGKKNNKKYDESTRLQLSYNLLKGASRLAAFKPCFKHYLPEQITSQVKMVPAEYWETALFFPSEQFKKETKSTVFSKSRGMI